MRTLTIMITLLLSLLVLPTKASAVENVDATAQLEQTLASLKGQVVYLDFWASWCGPCRQSFPWMNTVLAKYQDQGFTVVSINLDSNQALADEFLQVTPAKFQVIYDPKGKTAKQFKLKGMPSSYLINRQGELVSAHVGFTEKKQQQYEQEILTLLAQQVE